MSIDLAIVLYPSSSFLVGCFTMSYRSHTDLYTFRGQFKLGLLQIGQYVPRMANQAHYTFKCVI